MENAMNPEHHVTALRVDQLRLDFARLRLARPELIKSMEQSLAKFGQLSAIIVRQGKSGFEIIDGFKRYHLNFARRITRNEKGTATKGNFVNLKVVAIHPFGGLGIQSSFNDPCYFKGFFRCGSLLVAKFSLCKVKSLQKKQKKFAHRKELSRKVF
jgi:hypothetical protein